jgi:hypothetical protein
MLDAFLLLGAVASRVAEVCVDVAPGPVTIPTQSPPARRGLSQGCRAPLRNSTTAFRGRPSAGIDPRRTWADPAIGCVCWAGGGSS